MSVKEAFYLTPASCGRLGLGGSVDVCQGANNVGAAAPMLMIGHFLDLSHDNQWLYDW